MVFEVCGIFLDIFKVFNKVWYDELIFKPRKNGICRGLINILEDFLNNIKKRVILNGQGWSWADIHPAVPQG